MPKAKKLFLNIDLLKPQSEPQKLLVQAVKWALSAGRFLIIFVEIIVLAAFLARFKLDTDIADNKDVINQQLPFLEALKGDESLIRQTQSQLATLKDLKASRINFVNIMDKVSAQTPSGVTISTLSIENGAKLGLKITGKAQNNDQLSTLLFGLRSDPFFSEVNLDSINLDQGIINFSLSASINLGGKV